MHDHVPVATFGPATVTVGRKGAIRPTVTDSHPAPGCGGVRVMGADIELLNASSVFKFKLAIAT